MINNVDISSFMGWFINQFTTIGANLIQKIDNIIIYNNVSLLDFIITIAIIGAFLPLVITATNSYSKEIVKREKRKDKK